MKRSKKVLRLIDAVLMQLEEKLIGSQSKVPSLETIRSLRSLTQRHHLTQADIERAKTERKA